MKLYEYSKYITGLMYTREVKEPYRVDTELFDKVSLAVQASMSAPAVLDVTEKPKSFYAMEPDIAHMVPKVAREEIFYCLKNGFACVEVPAKCIFWVRKAYDLYKLPNLIPKLIPEKDMEIFLQKNYFANGITFKDVVQNFCYKEYIPIGEELVKCKYSTYSEIYIRDTDMVAAIPNKIADTLSTEDISNIYHTDNGLSLHGQLLRFLGGYHGATRSGYDLRALI